MVDIKTVNEELYFGDIDALAREYGVQAAIVDYGEPTKDISGRYLVLSPFKETIEDAKAGKLEIESHLKMEQSHESYIYPHLKVIKLEDESMSVAKKEANIWLKRYEAINICFKEKNLPVPYRILKGDLENIVEFSKNRTKSAYTTTDAFIDKQYTSYLKAMSKNLEKKESFTAIYNKNRKQLIKNPSDFYEKVASTYKFQLHISQLENFKIFMEREPNCLYCVSDVIRDKTFQVVDNGLSSGYREEDNSGVTIIMDATYKDMANEFFTCLYESEGIQTSDIEMVLCQDLVQNKMRSSAS